MAPKFDVESLGPGGRYAVERVADITGIESSSRVLELGAGHGIAGIHLAETRQCRVVATDIDMAKLERLQMRAMALRLEGLVDVGPLDCTKPFPHSSESFDLVMAGSVLDRTDAMHVPIAEAFRVLRPGGHIAIYGATWKRELDYRDGGVTRVLGKEVRSLADYEILLTEAGFRIAASRMLPDHLWADYYRQFVDALEQEQVVEDALDVPQPWGWYEEAAIVLTHLDVIGVGLVVGRKAPPPAEAERMRATEALPLDVAVEVAAELELIEAHMSTVMDGASPSAGSHAARDHHADGDHRGDIEEPRRGHHSGISLLAQGPPDEEDEHAAEHRRR